MLSNPLPFNRGNQANKARNAMSGSPGSVLSHLGGAEGSLVLYSRLQQKKKETTVFNFQYTSWVVLSARKQRPLHASKGYHICHSTHFNLLMWNVKAKIDWIKLAQSHARPSTWPWPVLLKYCQKPLFICICIVIGSHPLFCDGISLADTIPSRDLIC
jgi:hypothetical protein